jgi:hypothetical protein
VETAEDNWGLAWDAPSSPKPANIMKPGEMTGDQPTDVWGVPASPKHGTTNNDSADSPSGGWGAPSSPKHAVVGGAGGRGTGATTDGGEGWGESSGDNNAGGEWGAWGGDKGEETAPAQAEGGGDTWNGGGDEGGAEEADMYAEVPAWQDPLEGVDVPESKPEEIADRTRTLAEKLGFKPRAVPLQTLGPVPRTNEGRLPNPFWPHPSYLEQLFYHGPWVRLIIPWWLDQM